MPPPDVWGSPLRKRIVTDKACGWTSTFFIVLSLSVILLRNATVRIGGFITIQLIGYLRSFGSLCSRSVIRQVCRQTAVGTALPRAPAGVPITSVWEELCKANCGPEVSGEWLWNHWGVVEVHVCSGGRQHSAVLHGESIMGSEPCKRL